MSGTGEWIMKKRHCCSVGILLGALLTLPAAAVSAQAVGGAEKARPVAGDPGLSSMVVMDQAEFMVLRDYAEPGATRRMHSHDSVEWIVFTLVTGKLVLTFEGQAPMEVEPGQVLHFKGTARHTFKNVATVTATIVEVFGKARRE
jgi:quercetin dioxygenase-like cupin family protein